MSAQTTPSATSATNVPVQADIVFAEVGKEYGWLSVLDSVTLTVKQGEYVALMGPNGVGKTTLLRMAAGLTRPTSGSVTVAGVDLRRAGPGLHRLIGFVSHESLLYPELTGRENLLFAANLFGVDDAEQQIERLSNLLDLQRILDRPAGVLSRGNRQRLTLARTLLYNPRVLLLDEPFTGLDADSSETLTGIINTLVQDGRTVVMTTHDRNVAALGPSRIITLNEGGVASDVPSNPVKAVAAGNTDFLRAKLRAPLGRMRASFAIAGKDLRIELRTRDALGSAALFALSVLITASFTMPVGENKSGLATGVLWISILFAAMLGVGRSMARETADKGIEGLLLSPAPRESIFLGKLFSNLALIGLVDAIIIPLFLVMMTSDASGVSIVPFIATIILGSLGIVTVSTLFSGIAVGSRLGESMLPLLVMPIVIPLMVGSVELTRQALGSDMSNGWAWLAILGVFDAMVVLVSIATFKFVVEE